MNEFSLFATAYSIIFVIFYIALFYKKAEKISKPNSDEGLWVLGCALLWPLYIIFKPLYELALIAGNFLTLAAIKIAKYKSRI